MLKIIVGFVVGVFIGIILMAMATVASTSGIFHIYHENEKTRYLFEFNDLEKEIEKTHLVTFKVKVHEEEESNDEENL